MGQWQLRQYRSCIISENELKFTIPILLPKNIPIANFKGRKTTRVHIFAYTHGHLYVACELTEKNSKLGTRTINGECPIITDYTCPTVKHTTESKLQCVVEAMNSYMSLNPEIHQNFAYRCACFVCENSNYSCCSYRNRNRDTFAARFCLPYTADVLYPSESFYTNFRKVCTLASKGHCSTDIRTVLHNESSRPSICTPDSKAKKACANLKAKLNGKI